MTEQKMEDFLAHYGIMGMRWGRRKEEDHGGGQTSKSAPSSDQPRLGNESHGTFNDGTGAKGAKKLAPEGAKKNLIGWHPEHTATMKLLAKPLKDISDDELNGAAERLALVALYRKERSGVGINGWSLGSAAKNPHQLAGMSSKEIADEIKRTQVISHDPLTFRNNPTSLGQLLWDIPKEHFAKTASMEEVEKRLKRVNLEKKYADLQRGQLMPYKDLAEKLLSKYTGGNFSTGVDISGNRPTMPEVKVKFNT